MHESYGHKIIEGSIVEPQPSPHSPLPQRDPSKNLFDQELARRRIPRPRGSSENILGAAQSTDASPALRADAEDSDTTQVIPSTLASETVPDALSTQVIKAELVKDLKSEHLASLGILYWLREFRRGTPVSNARLGPPNTGISPQAESEASEALTYQTTEDTVERVGSRHMLEVTRQILGRVGLRRLGPRSNSSQADGGRHRNKS